MVDDNTSVVAEADDGVRQVLEAEAGWLELCIGPDTAGQIDVRAERWFEGGGVQDVSGTVTGMRGWATMRAHMGKVYGKQPLQMVYADSGQGFSLEDGLEADGQDGSGLAQ